MLQTTIAQSIECSGIGLHSGRKVRLRLLPAPADTGILFCIHNGTGTKLLQPRPESVTETGLATTLGKGEVRVATVEHLLAAIRGLMIDNVRIEVMGGEVPIMDGSAASFVFLLNTAGITRLDAPRKVLRLTRPLSLEEGQRRITARPHDGLRVDYIIDFQHPVIGVQALSLEVTPKNFVDTLSRARTFGFLKDVELLRRNGLAMGGSLENAVVLDDYTVLNPEGLRFPDEFVRHKLLDFIGDMALMDLPVCAHFTVACSGHDMNNRFMRLLAENRATHLEEATLAGPAPLPEPRMPARHVPAYSPMPA